VERRDINYLQSTIESYDGIANVSTVDPHEACMEIRISPGCEGIVFALLDALRKEGFMLSVKEPMEVMNEE
jgi:hypothetical protein